MLDLPQNTDAPVTISLVICTRNRAAQLGQCLSSLRALHCRERWELIVVNNGSTDDTQGVLERFRATFAHDMQIIAEMKPGLGRARNAGCKVARGEIIAFTDDDCYPYPDFLDEVLKAFNGRPTLGFIGGRILLHDPTDYRITIQERETREDLPPRSFIQTGLIQGANFALRRKALEQVAGFDDTFGAGAQFPCEDVDILARLSGAGWEGAYEPGPVVAHHHGRKTDADVEKLTRQYDRGRGAYYAKSLLNPALRKVTFRHWFWQVRHQPLRTTRRELAAAVEYWVRRII